MRTHDSSSQNGRPEARVQAGRLLLALALWSASSVAHGAKLPTPTTLGGVNQALDRKVAVISLENGTTISKARAIEVGPEITAWTKRGHRDQVPTSEVKRITVRGKRRALKGLALGAAVGAVIGGIIASGDSSDNDPVTPEFLGDTSPGRGALAGALSGALVGLTVGGLRRDSGQVVYKAPLAPYLESGQLVRSR